MAIATFKKSETIQGKWKALNVTEDGFFDDETGEEVDLHQTLLDKFGNTTFSLTAAYKQDIDLD